MENLILWDGCGYKMTFFLYRPNRIDIQENANRLIKLSVY